MITFTTTTDYVALSGAGVPIQTFGSADLAAAWVEDHGSAFPNHRIEKVRTRVTREVVWADSREAA